MTPAPTHGSHTRPYLLLDNHLSPALAAWITRDIGIPAIQLRDLGLATADDMTIFR